jgi:TM2 domain-containing membrane protein YozV
MSNPTVSSPPRHFSVLAGLLSYLVPGLGQIYQGRVAKGILFLVCIYALFFYGMWLGSGQVKDVTVEGQPYDEYTVTGNVYLPDATNLPESRIQIGFRRFQIIDYNPEGLAKALVYRPQFLGQFWVGVVAWPALIQYTSFDPAKHKEGHRLFGHFERTPPEAVLNKLQVAADAHGGGKRYELGWVYTVIAGVLNIMVIYDALAGPAHLAAPGDKKQEVPKHADAAAPAGS